MACNCNKCKPTKNCGCTDTGIVTPCTYTDCSTGSERCSDVQCTECVSYCGTSFQIGGTGTLIKIETGERLDSIIQKFALMLSLGVGACTADNIHHAPYNFYATNIAKTTVTLIWNGESTLTTGIGVYIDDAVTPTGWVLVNSTPVAAGVLKYDLTGLTPGDNYKIKLKSTDAGAATCDSVEILVDTLS
jgi:hypothetical protein